ncbi:NAD(P)H-binding protein [Kribbella monticola]|uniref:NAD(P)H-binding protein n=1 Tax=Kribbella monticola TaxID=2185285 RepID=UPI001300B2F3|nr:NAD(P)H-binding protein [Kribbella monticola]
MTTLVIGARGSIGRSVLDQLLAEGEPVRASVRRGGHELPEAVEVVAADLGDQDSLDQALDGVRRVFLYTPAPEQVEAVIRALEKAELERVVQLSSGSVLLESAAGNAIAEEHRLAEAAFARSALPWVPIRPLVLATNDLYWDTRGPVRLVRPEACTAPVHEHDIAAVAVAALTGAVDLEAASGMLTGAELLSQRERVAVIADVLGRPIEIEELTEDEARTVFPDSAQADAILDFLREAAAGGSPATGVVRELLGREPLSYRQWVMDHREDLS